MTYILLRLPIPRSKSNTIFYNGEKSINSSNTFPISILLQRTFFCTTATFKDWHGWTCCRPNVCSYIASETCCEKGEQLWRSRRLGAPRWFGHWGSTKGLGRSLRPQAFVGCSLRTGSFPRKTEPFCPQVVKPPRCWVQQCHPPSRANTHLQWKSILLVCLLRQANWTGLGLNWFWFVGQLLWRYCRGMPSGKRQRSQCQCWRCLQSSQGRGHLGTNKVISMTTYQKTPWSVVKHCQCMHARECACSPFSLCIYLCTQTKF